MDTTFECDKENHEPNQEPNPVGDVKNQSLSQLAMALEGLDLNESTYYSITESNSKDVSQDNNLINLEESPLSVSRNVSIDDLGLNDQAEGIEQSPGTPHLDSTFNIPSAEPRKSRYSVHFKLIDLDDTKADLLDQSSTPTRVLNSTFEKKTPKPMQTIAEDQTPANTPAKPVNAFSVHLATSIQSDSSSSDERPNIRAKTQCGRKFAPEILRKLNERVQELSLDASDSELHGQHESGEEETEDLSKEVETLVCTASETTPQVEVQTVLNDTFNANTGTLQETSEETEELPKEVETAVCSVVEVIPKAEVESVLNGTFNANSGKTGNVTVTSQESQELSKEVETPVTNTMENASEPTSQAEVQTVLNDTFNASKLKIGTLQETSKLSKEVETTVTMEIASETVSPAEIQTVLSDTFYTSTTKIETPPETTPIQQTPADSTVEFAPESMQTDETEQDLNGTFHAKTATEQDTPEQPEETPAQTPTLSDTFEASTDCETATQIVTGFMEELLQNTFKVSETAEEKRETIEPAQEIEPIIDHEAISDTCKAETTDISKRYSILMDTSNAGRLVDENVKTPTETEQPPMCRRRSSVFFPNDSSTPETNAEAASNSEKQSDNKTADAFTTASEDSLDGRCEEKESETVEMPLERAPAIQITLEEQIYLAKTPERIVREQLRRERRSFCGLSPTVLTDVSFKQDDDLMRKKINELQQNNAKLKLYIFELEARIMKKDLENQNLKGAKSNELKTTAPSEEFGGYLREEINSLKKSLEESIQSKHAMEMELLDVKKQLIDQEKSMMILKAKAEREQNQARARENRLQTAFDGAAKDCSAMLQSISQLRGTIQEYRSRENNWNDQMQAEREKMAQFANCYVQFKEHANSKIQEANAEIRRLHELLEKEKARKPAMQFPKPVLRKK